MSEFGIHLAILDWLRAVLPAKLILHIPNAPRSAIAGKRLKDMGMVKGAPDLLVVLPNQRPVFIEVKSPKGRLQKEQQDFMYAAHAVGAHCFVARSIDDCRKAFTALGIETREAR